MGTKEVEEQRRRMTDLLRHMEDGQLNNRSNVATDCERLDAEHRRILELQQTIRDVDRNNKEAMKHTWAQLEDEHRAFLEEKIRVESDICARRQERHRHIQCCAAGDRTSGTTGPSRERSSEGRASTDRGCA